jgi:dCTP deaminase
MILSNVDIQNALDQGRLVIDPCPQPRRPDQGVECPYQTSSVDLRLGHEITRLKDARSISFDLNSGSLKKTLADNSECIPFDRQYPLEPGQFVLGKTLERIELPITENGPWLAARVEGRSSYARCGLLVHFTAPTIHCGFEGTITLEIMNFGNCSILLKPETSICQLIVEEVTTRPFRNDSQFHGQTVPTGGTA